jgi:hypothetical protein
VTRTVLDIFLDGFAQSGCLLVLWTSTSRTFHVHLFSFGCRSVIFRPRSHEM